MNRSEPVRLRRIEPGDGRRNEGYRKLDDHRADAARLADGRNIERAGSCRAGGCGMHLAFGCTARSGIHRVDPPRRTRLAAKLSARQHARAHEQEVDDCRRYRRRQPRSWLTATIRGVVGHRHRGELDIREAIGGPEGGICADFFPSATPH
ncbi:MAG: hypothetical protein IH983_14940 [Planctomycetes bacterium]|nr:hypothetical protein [Planctomycetota bacterium]